MTNYETEQQIADFLRLVGANPNKPIPVSEIASVLCIKDSGSCPRTRKYILSAIENLGAPIGSNSGGYFMLNAEKELQVYLNGLMSRQVALSRRILAVYNAYHGK
jgi:hypothetical protein